MIFFLSLFILIFSIPADCLAKSNWNLIKSLTFSETYDSNISSTAVEVGDYITRVGGSLSAIYNGPHLGLEGRYIAQINLLARHPEENVFTQDGGFNIDLNRLFERMFKLGEVNVTEDFTFTPDLRDYYFAEERGEIGPLSSYGIRTRRSDAFRNVFGINVALPVTNRVKISTFYSNHLTEFKDIEFRDNITNTGGIGIRYAFPRDIFYSNVSASNIRQDTEDSNSYSYLIGITHSISPLTTFDINTGIATLRHEVRGGDTTFRGGVSLRSRSKVHTYNAGYQRNLNTVSGISGIPTIADIFYINITSIHTGGVNSYIGANYAVNRSIEGDEVNTRSYNLSGGLIYTIRKWLRSSLTLSHFNQGSDRPSAVDMQRDTITLAFTGTWE